MSKGSLNILGVQKAQYKSHFASHQKKILSFFARFNLFLIFIIDIYIIKKQSFKIMNLKGKIIVSLPTTNQEKRYAILILEHDHFGTIGFNLNCPLPHSFSSDLMDSLDISFEDHNMAILPRLYYGGTHELNQGMILHTKEYFSSSTVSINPQLALTNSLSLLQKIVDNHGPKQSIIILGHTRFMPGQIEDEIFDHRWLIVDPTPELIFGNQIWNDALITKGISPHQFQIHQYKGNA